MLEDDVIELGTIIERESTEIEVLKKEREEFRKLVEELKKEMLVSEKIVLELKNALDAQVRNFTDLESKFKQDALTLGKVNETIHEQESLVKKFNNENKEIKKTCDVIKKDNDRLQAEIKEVRIQMRSYGSENDEFKNERLTFGKEKMSLLNRYSFLDSN